MPYGFNNDKSKYNLTDLLSKYIYCDVYKDVTESTNLTEVYDVIILQLSVQGQYSPHCEVAIITGENVGISYVTQNDRNLSLEQYNHHITGLSNGITIDTAYCFKIKS